MQAGTRQDNLTEGHATSGRRYVLEPRLDSRYAEIHPFNAYDGEGKS